MGRPRTNSRRSHAKAPNPTHRLPCARSDARGGRRRLNKSRPGARFLWPWRARRPWLDLDFTRSSCSWLHHGDLTRAGLGPDRLIDPGWTQCEVGVVLIDIGLALLAQFPTGLYYLAVGSASGRMRSRSRCRSTPSSRSRQAAVAQASRTSPVWAFASTVFWVVGHQLEEASVRRTCGSLRPQLVVCCRECGGGQDEDRRTIRRHRRCGATGR